MWHTVPKFHTSKHLAASFKLGKPKFSWCFRHEHFCGRMAALGHSCSCGTKSLALSTKITEKYKLLMFIRQWQTREWEKVCKAAAICGRSTAEVFLWNIYMLHLWKNVNVQHNWMKYQYFGHKISIFEVRFLQQNIDIPGPYLDSEKQGLKQEIDTQKYWYSKVWKYWFFRITDP